MTISQGVPGRFTRRRSDFRAAYQHTLATGELAEKVDRARAALASCRLCPRDCGVDRLEGEIGVCRSGSHANVASAFAHFGEEDCLRGWRGSGTIFFSWCNLRCIFCQNWDISWQGDGRPMSAAAIASIMLDLERQGCHNINFVTPEHVVPHVLEAVYLAARRGLQLPIVYNTSAHDSAESLALLDGVVDIYMPDFKIWDEEVAKKLLLAADYPQTAREALRIMHRQVGDLVMDEKGLALRGLLVRHLVMPDGLAGTGEVMRFLARELSPDTYVNLMAQYRPAGLVLRRPERYREIGRAITAREYAEAARLARREGLHRFDGR